MKGDLRVSFYAAIMEYGIFLTDVDYVVNNNNGLSMMPEKDYETIHQQLKGKKPGGGTDAHVEELMMELSRLEAKVERFEIDISQRMTNTFDLDLITKVTTKATEMLSSAIEHGLGDIHRFKMLARKAGALRRFKMDTN